MKKIMTISGSFSAIAMILGLIFKFQHWPGASACIVLGILSGSLIFLPLFFTLKAKEKQSTRDKLVIGIGAFAASLQSLSILFKVMHWPYANMMGLIALVIMMVVFLPVYFFSGIRQAESRVNTIASSVVIVLGCGLLLTLIRTPQSSRMLDIRDTRAFLASEEIVKTERRQLERAMAKDSLRQPGLGHKIVAACEELKSYIIERETGTKSIGADFESKEVLLRERTGENPFRDSPASETASSLVSMVEEYNSTVSKEESGLKPIPVKGSCIGYLKNGNDGALSILSLLNQLSQIQMFVLQNERELLAQK